MGAMLTASVGMAPSFIYHSTIDRALDFRHAERLVNQSEQDLLREGFAETIGPAGRGMTANDVGRLAARKEHDGDFVVAACLADSLTKGLAAFAVDVCVAENQRRQKLARCGDRLFGRRTAPASEAGFRQRRGNLIECFPIVIDRQNQRLLCSKVRFHGVWYTLGQMNDLHGQSWDVFPKGENVASKPYAVENLVSPQDSTTTPISSSSEGNERFMKVFRIVTVKQSIAPAERVIP
jgi:hypothetical protein